MSLKITLPLCILEILSCASVKYNSHVGSDGVNGYLRTYYSSEKARVNALSNGTGIEHCKVQGSDVLCRDLHIVLPASSASPVDTGLPTGAVPALGRNNSPAVHTIKKEPAKKKK